MKNNLFLLFIMSIILLIFLVNIIFFGGESIKEEPCQYISLDSEVEAIGLVVNCPVFVTETETEAKTEINTENETETVTEILNEPETECQTETTVFDEDLNLDEEISTEDPYAEKGSENAEIAIEDINVQTETAYPTENFHEYLSETVPQQKAEELEDFTEKTVPTEPEPVNEETQYSEPAAENNNEPEIYHKKITGIDIDKKELEEKIDLLCDELKDLYFRLVNLAEREDISDMYHNDPKSFFDNYEEYLMKREGIKYRELFDNEDFLIKLSVDDYDLDQLNVLSEIAFGIRNLYGINFEVEIFISRYIQYIDLQKEYDQIIDNIIDDDMSEYDAVNRISDYLCERLSYQSGQQFPDIALETGKANCMGYSILFRTLCRKIGIDVEYVNGYLIKNHGAHAWNRVNIDDEWYYIDVTFTDAYGKNFGLTEKLWNDRELSKD